uniref:PARP catalytic domain-containing protein n=1 Tax=Mantoniella antarctica TaxID=81844 RepID=A0A7S0SAY3_9CHLO|mmetsp:Transcript_14013/g.33921  ORF Transcript_14013/g.33921 Transcript_14013/m.33921 type:complete len:378 (+) Transcript_14013:194-1327(+)
MTDVVVLGDSDSSGDDEVVEVVREIATAPAAGARARDRAGAQKRPRGDEPGNGNARGSGATAPPGRARGRGALAAEEPEVRITNEDVLVKREKAAQHLGRMVPGEVEARAAGRFAMFEIRAAPDDSSFDPEKEAAPEQMHFNRAVTYLSQMAGAGGMDKVQKVEYVVNPPVQAAYERNKAAMKARGVGEVTQQLLCHGTTPAASEAILRNNFSMDQCKGSQYGLGIYFSTSTAKAKAFDKGAMIMSLVLKGKVHVMPGPKPGCARKPGYDSHASDHHGTEIVIFDGNQVMPLYRVTFTKPGAPVAAVRKAAAVRGGREAANNAAALVAELQDSTARQQGTHAFVAQPDVQRDVQRQQRRWRQEAADAAAKRVTAMGW